jgi:hypothetical protein
MHSHQHQQQHPDNKGNSYSAASVNTSNSANTAALHSEIHQLSDELSAAHQQIEQLKTVIDSETVAAKQECEQLQQRVYELQTELYAVQQERDQLMELSNQLRAQSWQDDQQQLGTTEHDEIVAAAVTSAKRQARARYKTRIKEVEEAFEELAQNNRHLKNELRVLRAESTTADTSGYYHGNYDNSADDNDNDGIHADISSSSRRRAQYDNSDSSSSNVKAAAAAAAQHRTTKASSPTANLSISGRNVSANSSSLRHNNSDRQQQHPDDRTSVTATAATANSSGSNRVTKQTEGQKAAVARLRAAADKRSNTNNDTNSNKGNSNSSNVNNSTSGTVRSTVTPINYNVLQKIAASASYVDRYADTTATATNTTAVSNGLHDDDDWVDSRNEVAVHTQQQQQHQQQYAANDATAVNYDDYTDVYVADDDVDDTQSLQQQQQHTDNYDSDAEQASRTYR